MVETQYQRQIRVLQFDNGTEYTDTSFGSFLRQHGILHQTSCTYTLEQNGLAEIKNRQMMKVVSIWQEYASILLGKGYENRRIHH